MAGKDDVSLEFMKRRIGEALANDMNTMRWGILSKKADDNEIIIIDRWADNEFVLKLEKIT